jgi:hypothetical protein
MPFGGLPLDASGFIRMDALDAVDPEDVPGLPGRDDEPLEEARLERILERVFREDAQADASLLPAGGEAGPFDAADGADWHEPHPPAEHEPFFAGDEPEPETDDWGGGGDPGPDHPEADHGDDDLGWDS